MGLLLHLSDLHLSAKDEATGDYKAPGVPAGEQQHRRGLYEATLEGLKNHLLQHDQKLDAVVITGDVCNRFDIEGFSQLPELLGHLGDALPEPANVLVVPGNHDVPRNTAPSSPERYEAFIAGIRAANYSTPFLDGVDIEESGALKVGNSASPLVQAADGSFVVAGMNSSNYSAGTTPLAVATPDDLQKLEEEAKAGNEELAHLLEDVAKLRTADVARVSPGQMTAISRLLEGVKPSADGGPVRILALHHQLLPVSDSEEFKPFENLSNLGQVQSFVVANGLTVVLHGHKHVGHAYLDHSQHPIPSQAEWFQVSKRQPVLISSLATVGGPLAQSAEIARLVRVDGVRTRARTVVVDSLPATSPGVPYGDDPFDRVTQTITPRPVGGDAVKVVEGETLDDVYEQLLAIFDDDEVGPGFQVRNLVCRVRQGGTAVSVPDHYPAVPDGVEAAEWFEELIAWWQKPDPGLNAEDGDQTRPPGFNHGERVYRLDGYFNQLDGVVKALADDPGTTRGLVVLVDPINDDIGDRQSRFPSFSAISFILDRDQQSLNCTAYFRKQQMRVWWPVNAGEIAKLQQEVCRRLGQTVKRVKPGEIVTVAAVAVAGTNLPRVVVPLIDRTAQDEPQVLWQMALHLVQPAAQAEEIPVDQQWRGLFDDWLPTGQMEPDGVPVALSGLTQLAQAVRVVSAHAATPLGEDLAQALESLADINSIYAYSQDAYPDRSGREVMYTKWSGQVKASVDRILGMVDQLIAAAAPPADP